MIIHSRARKHGLIDEQIIDALATSSGDARIRDRDRDAEPPRWAMIGWDHSGRPIELVVVGLLGGEIMVIHANYLTQGFLNEIREAR
ncbi:hypothetical protein [Actinomyces radicidentis]|uniref:hypothetical protein n=1 Tax=Actinomyces radicidentis TaxID=111015 RepID=UPI000A015A15|nr:hypothetical protein [Actinomyces radicidentis]